VCSQRLRRTADRFWEAFRNSRRAKLRRALTRWWSRPAIWAY
jgi:hypothetical protein